MKNKKVIFISAGVVLILAALVLAVFFLVTKKPSHSPEEEKYIKQIEEKRGEKDVSMRDDADSPFNKKGKVEFHPLKYFDVDPQFVFHNKLTDNEVKDSITTQGTKGDIRKGVRWGYVTFNYRNRDYKINVYQMKSAPTGETYYAIWFTDRTTNDETYGVGRYLDFEKSEDPEHIYQIDFNLAYNPYCAYTSSYSCTVPLKEDFIDLAIEAGEKKFHD
jgi:uncharacterized protein (DUF1684 family)